MPFFGDSICWKTLEELAHLFRVPISYDKNGNVVKSTAETIVVRMFGAQKGAKINSLDILKKAGIIGKTIILSNKGGRTEDMKLFTVDFDDWLNKDIKLKILKSMIILQTISSCVLNSRRLLKTIC